MIRSRTVVMAAEILRNIPPNEDALYTINGRPRKAVDEASRCKARVGKPDQCDRSATNDNLCEGHEARRKTPPAYCEWDAPIKSTRGRMKGVSPGVRRDG